MGKRAVFDSLPIHDDLHDQCGTLCEKEERPSVRMSFTMKNEASIFSFSLSVCGIFQIEQTEDKGAELTDDSGQGQLP